MNDITLSETTVTKKSGLTARFVATGVVAIILIVSGMAVCAYSMLRSSGINNEGERVSVRISEALNLIVGKAGKVDTRKIVQIGKGLSQLKGFESVAIYNTESKLIWPNRSTTQLSPEDMVAATELLSDAQKKVHIFDLDLRLMSTWKDALVGKTEKLPILVVLTHPSGEVFSLAKINYDFKTSLARARYFSLRVLLAAFGCSILLFLALYYTFQRGIKTIKQQEDKLNQQIERLSNMLSLNKGMQKSMKTASARAVELNEQFLRRVGADLHDGPAQMIGFAVLRLNQVSKQEAAKLFGHEFHAVREALDESLEEIRGISSGLVLPELETMSLEQCLRKVVTLHGAKSKAEVAQYYQELPTDIPLPIKICAYRFIQEGLNNAHRHGDAKKCRLSAYVKDQQLVISLKDNGIGFRKSKLKQGGAHLGLVGLKDRVESLGGSFSINSELGVGTALKVEISLADVE